MTAQYWMPTRQFTSFRNHKAAEMRNAFKYDTNTWVFINAWGSGNIYTMMALMDAFIKYHCTNGEKIILIIKKPYTQVAEMFSQFDGRLMIVTGDSSYVQSLEQEFGMEQNFARGEPILFSPVYHGRGDLLRLLYLRNTSMCDIYKYMLSIPFDTKPVKPVLPQKFIDIANEKLAALGPIGDKAILLASNSVTFPLFPADFWPLLSHKLKAAGYDVFSDSANGTQKPIEGTREIRFTFGEGVTIANRLGCVITHQSGLTHLLSSSTCKLRIVYPGPIPAQWYPFPYSGISLENSGFRETEEAIAIPTTNLSTEQSVDMALSGIINS